MASGVVRLLPAAMSDAALADSVRDGVPGASELLFQRYGTYIERLIVSTVGFDSQVPDLINEAFAAALGAIGQLRESSALRGWIGSVAINTARTFVRDRRNQRRWVRFQAPGELPESASPPTVDPDARRLFSRAYALLDRLPSDERVAFALRFIDDMKLTEIAEVTRSSLATVKRRLTRAQRRFSIWASADSVLREHLSEMTVGSEP